MYNENGLSPNCLVSHISNRSQAELHNKTLEWINVVSKSQNILIKSNIETDFISFMGVKENFLNEGKLYLHMKYVIKVSFKNGQYKFEPLEIASKVNSKYDMGWKSVNLKNGSDFFKKGKAIKKTKSYVKKVPEALNNINNILYNYLTTH